jgi:hypothetical protein
MGEVVSSEDSTPGPSAETCNEAVVKSEEDVQEESLNPIGGKRKALPEDTEDAARLDTRRAANRLHAFKSRQRSKNLALELQQQVEELQKDMTELERTNAVLGGKIEVLMMENQQLLFNQQMMSQRPQQMTAPEGSGSFPPMFQRAGPQQQQMPGGGGMMLPASMPGSMGNEQWRS